MDPLTPAQRWALDTIRATWSRDDCWPMIRACLHSPLFFNIAHRVYINQRPMRRDQWVSHLARRYGLDYREIDPDYPNVKPPPEGYYLANLIEQSRRARILRSSY